MKNYEIVERSSGYWIVDGDGYTQGPYDTIQDADEDIPTLAQVQYPLLDVQEIEKQQGLEVGPDGMVKES
tara:strand:+ start:437 stop:646 length:210 start_codon:yes stop_codon:yes gene_type:complete